MYGPDADSNRKEREGVEAAKRLVYIAMSLARLKVACTVGLAWSFEHFVPCPYLESFIPPIIFDGKD